MTGLRTRLFSIPCLTRPLHAADMSPDPYKQFDLWMHYARRAGLPEPNAMSIASVGPDGLPSQRMVLLKHISPPRGLVFYTNYGSRKASELDNHPLASALFFHPVLYRQIRVTGRVERSSREESEAYFRTRPRGSQVGAWASRQSEPLDHRETFDTRCAEVEERFKGKEIPCPTFWGGYRLLPSHFEFWQGRAHRLHDRFVYSPCPEGGWSLQRLYP